jgi:hypothetical protein
MDDALSHNPAAVVVVAGLKRLPSAHLEAPDHKVIGVGQGGPLAGGGLCVCGLRERGGWAHVVERERARIAAWALSD